MSVCLGEDSDPGDSKGYDELLLRYSEEQLLIMHYSGKPLDPSDNSGKDVITYGDVAAR